jgi:23S rRNA (guanine745-N1)-methyltransferase
MFACPICKTHMRVVGSKSFICLNNHTFDIAKRGYVNFMNRPIKTKYTTELFHARRDMITKSGMYHTLCQTIADIIASKKKDSLTILDTGCGEGSHLASICHQYVRDTAAATGIGIDLSKEGISFAAKEYDDLIWSVADLAGTPFKDRQFDVILNILSPANYMEFNRVLKDNGILIKVIPQADYLKEIRHFFLGKKKKTGGSNAHIIKSFKKNFLNMEQIHLHYSQAIRKSDFHSLLQMTPLTWNQSKQKVQQFLENECIDITVDLDILIGWKPLNRYK